MAEFHFERLQLRFLYFQCQKEPSSSVNYSKFTTTTTTDNIMYKYSEQYPTEGVSTYNRDDII